MVRLSAPSPPTDETLAGFTELFAERPRPVLALYEEAGSAVGSISRIHATWKPGWSLTVRYLVQASSGRLPGRRDVVARIGAAPDSSIVVEGPEGPVSLWIVPDDPFLPGLRSALHLPTVQVLLESLGAMGTVSSSRLRSYRPGHRAVVQVEAGGSSLFIKVVRPSEVDALHRRHRHLAEYLPIPDSLGVAPDLGVVVIQSLPGIDLRSALRQGVGPLPDHDAIAGIVESLPRPRTEWQSKSSIEMLPGIVDLLCRLVPHAAERLGALVDEIGPERSEETVPVHGDFHGAQILIDGRGIPIGLLDVDTYGWGRPADDAATMLGHLHLLAPGCPSNAIELARRLNRLWDATVDPVELRLRTAAVVLGLATGPFRVQRNEWRDETLARIEIAERWVQSARRIDERSLIPASGSPHAKGRS